MYHLSNKGAQKNVALVSGKASIATEKQEVDSPLSKTGSGNKNNLKSALTLDTFAAHKTPSSTNRSIRFNLIELPNKHDQTFETLFNAAKNLAEDGKETDLLQAGPYFMEAYHEARKIEDKENMVDTVFELSTEMLKVDVPRFNKNVIKILRETRNDLQNQLQKQEYPSPSDQSALHKAENFYETVKIGLISKEFNSNCEQASKAIDTVSVMPDGPEKVMTYCIILDDLISLKQAEFDDMALDLLPEMNLAVKELINFNLLNPLSITKDSLETISNTLKNISSIPGPSSDDLEYLDDIASNFNLLKEELDIEALTERYEQVSAMALGLQKVIAYCALVETIVEKNYSQLEGFSEQLLDEISTSVTDSDLRTPIKNLCLSLITKSQNNVNPSDS